MRTLKLSLVGLLSLVAVPAFAHPFTNREQRRDDRQEIRRDRFERHDDSRDLAELKKVARKMQRIYRFGNDAMIARFDARIVGVMRGELAESRREMGQAAYEVRGDNREIRAEAEDLCDGKATRREVGDVYDDRHDRRDDRSDFRKERSMLQQRLEIVREFDRLAGAVDRTSLLRKQDLVVSFIDLARRETFQDRGELREDHGEAREDRRERREDRFDN